MQFIATHYNARSFEWAGPPSSTSGSLWGRRESVSRCRRSLSSYAAVRRMTPLGQNEDPQDTLNRLGRRLEIENQQKFEDRQRQRLLDQQEQAYDRRKCIQAGYDGPDVEQCIRASASLRRGVEPGQ
jgi:hypothetical protein